jgi:hypothetical protein
VAEIVSYLETYKEDLPSQRPASFSIEEPMEDMHRVVDPEESKELRRPATMPAGS